MAKITKGINTNNPTSILPLFPPSFTADAAEKRNQTIEKIK